MIGIRHGYFSHIIATKVIALGLPIPLLGIAVNSVTSCPVSATGHSRYDMVLEGLTATPHPEGE